jgi:hypothetical protein
MGLLFNQIFIIRCLKLYIVKMQKLFRNKYKLMLLMALLYLVADGIIHKGMIRVMLPKNFEQNVYSFTPINKRNIPSPDKFWKKAVNTIQALQVLDKNAAGCEMDVYFDTIIQTFTIHHDPGGKNGFTIDNFMEVYHSEQRHHCLWFDFKNLSEANAQLSLQKLVSIKKQYNLHDKILVESSNAALLNAFADSGLFTIYYTPYSLVYKNSIQQNKNYIDSVAGQIKTNKISALSGYYFQQPILQAAFPNFPILQWQANDRFSLVNWLYNKKVQQNRAILVSLQP